MMTAAIAAAFAVSRRAGAEIDNVWIDEATHLPDNWDGGTSTMPPPPAPPLAIRARAEPRQGRDDFERRCIEAAIKKRERRAARLK